MTKKYTFNDFLQNDVSILKTILLVLILGQSISVNAQCTVATNGLYPESTFTSTCTGATETIVTDAYASEYSNVLIDSNNIYTFSSSVTTDYITITNVSANIVYASGTSPLIWNSGPASGTIRYYLHTNSSCGEQSTNRQKFISCQYIIPPCVSPSNLTVSNVYSTNAQINWNAASPAPILGYDFYISSTNFVTPTTTPTGSINGLTNILNNLVPGTTYYFWVRSSCGNSRFSNWVAGSSFTTLFPSGTGCISSLYGLYPTTTFTPSCTGTNENIVSDATTGEYTNINIVPNVLYTFTSSDSTDFITIANENATVIYASGTTPLTWDSTTNSGVLRYYIHLNSSCDSSNALRTKSISCQSTIPVCTALPSNLTVSNILTTNAQLNWNAASPAPENGYDVYFSITNSISPTTIPSGTLTGLVGILNNLLPSTTYYFWIRSNCGSSNVSSWVSGGSFTTATPTGTGCITAPNGLYPTTTFTPTCTGANETIVTDAYAGEYSKVTIITNKQYTFTSSIATDFITITNADASIIYTSGVSPLVWNSTTNSGVIRYYFHTNSTCGEENIIRTRYITCPTEVQPCSIPSNLTVSNILTTSVQLNWNAASPVPANGYNIYYSTINLISPTTAPSVSVGTSNGLLSGLMPSTTYYFWVRSNCGNSNVSSWVSGGSFTTASPTGTGCITASNGLYPTTTFTPTCSGANETIVTDAYAGEYSNVNIVSNKQYTFSSSIATDYISISNANATVIYTSGTTPLIWNSTTNSGVIRYYFHTNDACGEQNIERTKSILCQDAVSVCTAPSNLTVSNVLTTSVELYWNAASPVPLLGYDSYISTTNSISPTSIPNSTITALGGVINNLLPTTTYYFWIRSNCGNSNVSSWVSGGSFTTATPTGTGCITAPYGTYPLNTFTPTCSSANETIVTDAYAGEYSNVNIVSNKQYTFSSSIATDYISISNANATVIYASGTTPLVWNSTTNSGVIRYYFHTNDACGEQNTNRIRYISCTTTLNNTNFENSFAKIYPNPTSNIVNIVGDNNFDSVLIVNGLGQTVNEIATQANQVQVDVSNYASGIYFIKVFIGKVHQTYKLLKE